MKNKFLALATVALFSTSLFVSCNSENKDEMNDDDNMEMSEDMDNDMDNEEMTEEEPYVMVGGAKMVPSKDIVDNAMAANNVTTLVAAVKAAGLVETLKGDGPFTVFAPTDDAFAALPDGTVDNLMKPENKEKLTNILTYHVVPGSLRSTDLKDGQMLETVNGKKITVKMKDGNWMIDDAQVIIPDVISSNGVTHVINKVLMPKK